MADRDVLQVDQAEPYRKVLLGAFRKRSEDALVGCHLHFPDCDQNQSLSKRLSVHHHRSHNPDWCLHLVKNRHLGTAH